MYCTDGYELTVLYILNLFIEPNEYVKVFGNSGGALSYSIAWGGGDGGRKGRKKGEKNMSGPGAGFEYPRTEVSWVKRDALLFANSIGCTADELHFLYVRNPPPLPHISRIPCSSDASYLSGLIGEALFSLLFYLRFLRSQVPQELDPNFAVFPTYPLILRSSRP